jgi:hypothetical protein
MDFMGLLRSVEDILFEIVSWLYFYPRTFLLSLFRPQRMMAYADDELDDRPQARYESTINPPVFLMITIAMASSVSDFILGPEAVAQALKDSPEFLRDWKNDLMFTAFIFSIYPLLLSIDLLRHRKIAIDRASLRPPFYSQCFIAAPFGLANYVALAFMSDDTYEYEILGAFYDGVYIGFPIFLLTLAWYTVQQARWFRRELGTPLLKSCWIAAFAIFKGFFVTSSILLLIEGAG